MKNLEIPLLIKRCLVFQVRIYPHQLDTVLKKYEKHKIPDDILSHMKQRDLEDYVKGLYLSGLEMAGDWTDGHKILKELGFLEKKVTEGHRQFLNLYYPALSNEVE